jgi:acyl-CoA thioesterase-2
MTAPCQPLLALLDLQELEPGVYLGPPSETLRSRVFGGQLLAQALAAASFSVDGAVCHSLHAQFLRPGIPGRPIHYEVLALRDAKRLATRQVNAVQRDELIFQLTASFQADDGPGPEHQEPAPEVPAPEALPDPAIEHAARFEAVPAEQRAQFENEFPVELRFVEPRDFLAPNPTPVAARHHVWLRTAGSLPEYPNLQRCALAFMSDLLVLHGCMRPLGRSVFDPRLQVASLDHALWFHRPLRADDWLLCSLDAPSVAQGRGVGRGLFHDRQGRLVASMVQEGMIYERPA